MSLMPSFRIRGHRGAHERADTALLTPLPDTDLSLPDPDLSVTEALRKQDRQDAAYAATASLPAAPCPEPGPSPVPGYPAAWPPPLGRVRAGQRTEAWAPGFTRSGPQPAARPSGPQPSFRPSGPQPVTRVRGLRPLMRPLSPPVPTRFAAHDPQISQRQVTAARARLGRLPYPQPDPCDETGGARQYAELMQHIDRITGTTSRYGYAEAWPYPVAPEVPNRGLAITADPALDQVRAAIGVRTAGGGQ